MPAPYLGPACPLMPGRSACFVVFAAAACLACENTGPPTAAHEPAATTVRSIPSGAIEPADVTAQGTIPLPINQSVASSTPAFAITQTGSGTDGYFTIRNGRSSSTALLAVTAGLGLAGDFIVNNSSNSSPALLAVTTGTGRAAQLQISSSSNSSPALYATTQGTGPAVNAVNNGTGPAAALQINNTNSLGIVLDAATTGKGQVARFTIQNTSNLNPALNVTTSGLSYAGAFGIVNSSNGSPAVYTATTGKGPALVAKSLSSGNGGGPGAYIQSSGSTALQTYNFGTGWAGQFFGTNPGGKGVYIQTNGGAGLQVVGGSKQAVVPTAGGARSLYTEESSEVWFTDYGFGRLENGRARILLDPTFAQTINVEQAYHVFVQPYGDAELYVSNRNSLGFEVRLRGGDPGVEFSYRVVAKRRGFEAARLEPAPWADHAVAVAPMR